MRVTRLRVGRYGGWRDLDLELQGRGDGAPVVFLGANEAGKTSLAAFVLDMLLGFEAPTRGRHVYAPWDGDPLRGSLELVAADRRRCRVERRLAGRAEGQWIDRERARALGNAPLPPLADWDRRAFKSFFCLNADEMSRMGEAGFRCLETRLLFGGMGERVSPLRQAELWDAEARRLWRADRRGRPVARRLGEELRELDRLILELSSRRRDAGRIRRRIGRLEGEAAALEDELEVLEVLRRESLARRAELQAWLRLQEEDGAVLVRLGRALALREHEVSELERAVRRPDLLDRWPELRRRLRPRPDWSRRLRRWRDELRGWGERLDKGARLWGLSPETWRSRLDGLTERDLRHVRRTGRWAETAVWLAVSLGLVGGGVWAARGRPGEGALLAAAFVMAGGLALRRVRALRFRPLGEVPVTRRLRRASAAFGFLDGMKVIRQRERDLIEEMDRLKRRGRRIRRLRGALAHALGLASDRPWEDLATAITAMAGRLIHLRETRRRVTELRRMQEEVRQRLRGRRAHIRGLRRWLEEESVTRRWLSLREKKDETEAALQAQRARLAEIGEETGLDELERRRADLATRLEGVRLQSFRLRLQAAVLREACRRVAGVKSASLLRRTSEIAAMITRGRVAEVFVVDDDARGGGSRLAVRGSEPGSSRPVAVPLSRGLVEQIWFAWRMAHAEALDPAGLCPLLLD